LEQASSTGQFLLNRVLVLTSQHLPTAWGDSFCYTSQSTWKSVCHGSVLLPPCRRGMSNYEPRRQLPTLQGLRKHCQSTAVVHPSPCGLRRHVDKRVCKLATELCCSRCRSHCQPGSPYQARGSRSPVRACPYLWQRDQAWRPLCYLHGAISGQPDCRANSDHQRIVVNVTLPALAFRSYGYEPALMCHGHACWYHASFEGT
jgi:hypothetical protein